MVKKIFDRKEIQGIISNENDELNIGFVGYCPPTEYDEKEAEKLIKVAFDNIEIDFTNCNKYKFISGVTNVGTLKQAYQEAARRGWELYGVACKKAKDFEWFPDLDEENVELVGENWGDESDKFVSKLDIIVRVGGGEQSINECTRMIEQGKVTYEYELDKKLDEDGLSI